MRAGWIIAGIGAALGACAEASAPRQEPVPAATPAEGEAAPAADAGAPGARAEADAAVPAPSGCGLAAASGLASRQVVAKGKTRTFHVAVPPAYDPRVPHAVVFLLHGATDTDPSSMHDWFPVAPAVPGALGVYPQALPRTHADGSGGNVTRWDTTGDEDLAFFDAMLADLEATLCVDRARVVATGFSSGGNFAQQLGCLRATKVRAIAPVAGPGPFEDSCPSPMAVWMTHDANDDALPVSGARASRDFWRAQNGCKGTWKPDPLDSACSRDVSCPTTTPLVYCETKGVGHDVPAFAPAAIARFFTAL